LIPRKAIQRKPLASPEPAAPAREQREVKSETDAGLPEVGSHHILDDILGGGNAYDAGSRAIATDTSGSLSPPPIDNFTAPGRTMSLMADASRNLNFGGLPHRSRSSVSLANQLSPTWQDARFSQAMLPPKTSSTPPPPVSLVTRGQVPLRVPAPLRQHHNSPSLSRKSSREKVQSYPSSNGPSLSRRYSRENIQSYPSYQNVTVDDGATSPPNIPPQNPRRSLSKSRSQYFVPSQRIPNWDVQTDHDFSRPASTEPSYDNLARHNSLSSASLSHVGYSIQRPASVQSFSRGPPPQHRQQPPLRHRSSYDASGFSQFRDPYTQPSTMHFDPWSSTQELLAAHQYDQGGGRYPPYVPRGHYRNRSMGSRQANPAASPYRILHSYNSPAYRNAPIWG
jgi:hypothetical protein